MSQLRLLVCCAIATLSGSYGPDVKATSPAFESRLVETSRFYAFGAAELPTKMPREEYMRSPQFPIDGLPETNRDYPHGVFGNVYFQHHNDVHYGFTDHGAISDYICSQQRQSLDTSHIDEYSTQSNYNEISFEGRCPQKSHIVTFSPISVDTRHRGDIYNNYYIDEAQQSHIFNTASYKPMTTSLHNDHNLKISLMNNADYVATQHTDSENEAIHSLTINAVSNDFPERHCQREDEGIAVVSRKSGSVARRNARERKRIKNVNVAFDSLRQRVPQGSKGNKISKVETLRSAIEYIRALQELVTEMKSRKQRDAHCEDIEDAEHRLENGDEHDILESVVVGDL